MKRVLFTLVLLMVASPVFAGSGIIQGVKTPEVSWRRANAEGTPAKSGDYSVHTAPYFHFVADPFPTPAVGFVFEGGAVSIPITDMLSASETPAFDELNELLSAYLSAGLLTGGQATDMGSRWIEIDAGQGIFHTSDSETASLAIASWAVLDITLPVNTNWYVGVEYNAGAPRAVTSAYSDFSGNNEFELWLTICDADEDLHIQDHRDYMINSAQHVSNRFHAVTHIQLDNTAGGLDLGETGTRNITLSSGGLYIKVNRIDIPAIDTSGTDTFARYYSNGSGGWIKQHVQTQWDNTHFDDGDGGLATIQNNWYSYQDFYLESDGHLVCLFGQDEFPQQSGAEEAGLSSTVPIQLLIHSIFIGRAVFQESTGTAVFFSPFEREFGFTGVSDHNELSNIGLGSGHIPTPAATYASQMDQNVTTTSDVALGSLMVGNITPTPASGNLHVENDGTVGGVLEVGSMPYLIIGEETPVPTPGNLYVEHSTFANDIYCDSLQALTDIYALSDLYVTDYLVSYGDLVVAGKGEIGESLIVGNITPVPTPGSIYVERDMFVGNNIEANNNIYAYNDLYVDDVTYLTGNVLIGNEGEGVFVVGLSGRAEFGSDALGAALKVDWNTDEIQIFGPLAHTNEGEIRRFLSNHSEVWTASTNVLSFGAGATPTPVVSFDLDNGNTDIAGDLDIGGDVILAVDQKVTMPADSSGDGPFRISGLLDRVISGVIASELNNGGYAIATISTIVFAVSIPEEVNGGTVVIDEMNIVMDSSGNGDYITAVQLYKSLYLEEARTLIVTHAADIGNGDTDTNTQNILVSDLSRVTHPGVLVIEVQCIIDVGAVFIEDLIIEFHTE